jgi:ribosome-associated protein
VASSLEAGKAENVTVLSVGEMTTIADYFVIASGSTQRQVKALADRVTLNLADARKPSHVEGYDAGVWVLMDFGDVVVHVFREQERAFYGLERLWGDAPRLDWAR